MFSLLYSKQAGEHLYAILCEIKSMNPHRKIFSWILHGDPSAAGSHAVVPAERWESVRGVSHGRAAASSADGSQTAGSCRSHLGFPNSPTGIFQVLRAAVFKFKLCFECFYI